MKNTLMKYTIPGIVAGVVLALSPFTFGQAVETTTTTSSAGTITTFDPNAIVIKSETSTEPVRYQYTKKTVYVDENGNPVSIETIKSGLPVTVYYDREGDGMVATKVVVRKAVTTTPEVAETTTTQTAGTISSFDPQEIVVKTEGGAEPLRYHYTKTTTYVDENGNPVSIETVKSGMPVTVFYEKQGDQMIARRVIVRQAPGAVIEHKKTTTTTTEER
ncbi:MAG TPA: hypothetical protein VG733_03365 [Chthoniobacteraceae bacterium]|nr:hypothetical protein [Chthoniobacteraceae bacterium]